MKCGIPSVLLATERFSALATTTFKAQGVRNPPLVVLPRTEVTEFASPEEVARLAMESLREVVRLWSNKEDE